MKKVAKKKVAKKKVAKKKVAKKKVAKKKVVAREPQPQPTVDLSGDVAAAIRSGVAPGTDLTKVDLRDQSFDGVTLTAVDLSKARLGGSVWRGCRFANSGVGGVQLAGADLSGATFEDCRFEIVHAEGLKAKGARFLRCTFGFANLDKAALRGASFEDVAVTADLYLRKADCRGLQVSLVAHKDYGPKLLHFDEADLRGATLAARLSEAETQRVLKFDLTKTRWSEFKIQGAKLDDKTAISYGELPFAAQQDEAPKPKLRNRSEVLDCDGWGTIAAVVVEGDVVVAGEGGWSGDASRHGADGHYRVRAWRGGRQLWERKLEQGSGTDRVLLAAAEGKVYCLIPRAAFALDLLSGEVVDKQVLKRGNGRFWASPGLLTCGQLDHCDLRRIGEQGAIKLPGRYLRTAAPGGNPVLTEYEYDRQVGAWVYLLYDHRTNKELLRQAGRLRAACYSADGSRLAIAWGDLEQIVIYDGKTGRELKGFAPAPDKKRQPKVAKLALSGDGKLVAGVCGPTSVVIWDARAGEVVKTLGRQEPPVEALVFSPDGDKLYVGTGQSKEPRAVSVYPL